MDDKKPKTFDVYRFSAEMKQELVSRGVATVDVADWRGKRTYCLHLNGVPQVSVRKDEFVRLMAVQKNTKKQE